MRWICIRCHSENDYIISSKEGAPTCICGYELSGHESEKNSAGGWLYFLWACPGEG